MEATQSKGALNVAVDAALEAGKFIAQNLTQLDRVKVTQKSSNQWVTEIDVLAEQRIVEHLAESYPDYAVLAEESGSSEQKSDYCWVIDPIDGTHNFMHGHPNFAVSIALKHEDEILIGVIYDPLRNELFTARKGAGAQLDGRRIRVSEVSRLNQSLLCTGFPYREQAELKTWLKTFARVLPRAQSVHRTGSSVLDLAYVAVGRYDGFWQMGLRDWDIAAGALIIKEAGGLIADLSGDVNVFKSGNIVAGNPRIYEKLAQLLKA